MDALQQGRTGVMFARADEYAAYTGILRAADVVLDIVAHHYRFVGGDADGVEGLLEEGAVGLTQDGGLFAGCGF